MRTIDLDLWWMDKTLHLLILMFNCQDLAQDERRSRDCWRSPHLITSTLKDEYSLMSLAKSFSLAWDNGITPQVQPRADNTTFCDSVFFTADNVRKTLLSVKPSTSSGPDGIPNVLLKKLAHSICNPLCYIFDSSFKSHRLPSQWLQAVVTPFFKKGTTSDPANCRPIPLICTCCRVMERIISTHLIDYLLCNKLISKHQHGFLVKHSTCTNLLETVND